MKTLLKTRSILLILCNVALFTGMSYFELRSTQKAAVINEIASAAERVQHYSGGTLRVDRFVMELKAINTSNAPPVLKSALHDYVSAMELLLQELHAGRTGSQYADLIADAKQSLVEACRESQ